GCLCKNASKWFRLSSDAVAADDPRHFRTSAFSSGRHRLAGKGAWRLTPISGPKPHFWPAARVDTSGGLRRNPGRFRLRSESVIRARFGDRQRTECRVPRVAEFSERFTRRIFAAEGYLRDIPDPDPSGRRGQYARHSPQNTG